MIEFMFYQLIIASLCAGTPGQYNAACSKTVEATSITIGVNQFEDQLTAFANRRGQYLFGQDMWNTTGFVGGMAYQAAVKKSVSYKIKTKKTFLGADFVRPQLDYRGKEQGRGGSLNFGWSW